jgi:acyl-CoA reductase-like NAD-dependent aldehyde dehydrogenase
MTVAARKPAEDISLMRIGGQSVPARSGKTSEIINPANGDVLALVAEGAEADVEGAVSAATHAFASGIWRHKSADEKSRILWRVAELIEAHKDELARLETQNLGAPIWMTQHQVARAAEAFRYYAGWASKIHGTTADVSKPGRPGFAFTRKEPVGVAGLITPWNFPLLAAAWKLGPALAAGCTTVLKPAQETPLTSLRLADLLTEAGVPESVVNVVTGGGAAGAAIASHRNIAKISFTGSTATAKKIIEAAAGNLKRLTLELGGKSPLVICEDADLSRAIPAAAQVMFINSGQVCTAGSRLYVEGKIYDQVLEGISATIKQIGLGDPLEATTMMGPLVSERQLARVSELVESGRLDGATIVFGGRRHGEKGFFYEPTLLSNVNPSMRVMREEIFGPVICATRFDDLDAIMGELNDSDYGLAAYIWTTDLLRMNKFVAEIEAGTVLVNSGAGTEYNVSFGGLKQSGWGREHGPEGIQAFLETKSVFMDLTV